MILDTAQLVLIGCGINPNEVTFDQAMMAYRHRDDLMGGL